MYIKQSMFRDAKDNILLIIHYAFLMILLTSGNHFIAFFPRDAKEKNWKMNAVYNIIEGLSSSFFQRVRIRIKLSSSI